MCAQHSVEMMLFAIQCEIMVMGMLWLPEQPGIVNSHTHKAETCHIWWLQC